MRRLRASKTGLIALALILLTAQYIFAFSVSTNLKVAIDVIDACDISLVIGGDLDVRCKGTEITDVLTLPDAQASNTLKSKTESETPDNLLSNTVPHQVNMDSANLQDSRNYDNFTQHYNVQIFKENTYIKKQCSGARTGGSQAPPQPTGSGPVRVTVSW